MKILKIHHIVIILSSFFIITHNVEADDSYFFKPFPYKDFQDFPGLSEYDSVEAFEAAYKTYKQDCLDNSGGGAGGAHCFIGELLWRRELTNQLQRLEKALSTEEFERLRNDQSVWEQELARAQDVIAQWAKNTYPGPGTMYIPIRVGMVDERMMKLTRSRVLELLKMR